MDDKTAIAIAGMGEDVSDMKCDDKKNHPHSLND